MTLETLSVGVSTTLVGMGVVFSVLVILALVTSLVAKLSDGDMVSKKAAAAPAAAPAPAAPVAAADNKVDAKTAAIIMSAVSSYCGQPISKLRFVSIKRGKFN